MFHECSVRSLDFIASVCSIHLNIQGQFHCPFFASVPFRRVKARGVLVSGYLLHFVIPKHVQQY